MNGWYSELGKGALPKWGSMRIVAIIVWTVLAAVGWIATVVTVTLFGQAMIMPWVRQFGITRFMFAVFGLGPIAAATLAGTLALRGWLPGTRGPRRKLEGFDVFPQTRTEAKDSNA